MSRTRLSKSSGEDALDRMRNEFRKLGAVCTAVVRKSLTPKIDETIDRSLLAPYKRSLTRLLRIINIAYPNSCFSLLVPQVISVQRLLARERQSLNSNPRLREIGDVFLRNTRKLSSAILRSHSEKIGGRVLENIRNEILSFEASLKDLCGGLRVKPSSIRKDTRKDANCADAIGNAILASKITRIIGEALPLPYIRTAFETATGFLECMERVRQNDNSLTQLITRVRRFLNLLSKELYHRHPSMNPALQDICYTLVGETRAIQHSYETNRKRTSLQRVLKTSSMRDEILSFEVSLEDLRPFLPSIGMRLDLAEVHQSLRRAYPLPPPKMDGHSAARTGGVSALPPQQISSRVQMATLLGRPPLRGEGIPDSSRPHQYPHRTVPHREGGISNHSRSRIAPSSRQLPAPRQGRTPVSRAPQRSPPQQQGVPHSSYPPRGPGGPRLPVVLSSHQRRS